MGSKKYVVDLTEAERTQCEQLLKKGKNSAEQVQRARILLKSDIGGANWKDKEIAEALDCSVSTVEKVRQRPLMVEEFIHLKKAKMKMKE